MAELNKKQARLYNDEKACDEVMRHLSATYLLFSLGINHFGQAEDILHRFGLIERDIKQAANRLENDFDRFDSVFRRFVLTNDQWHAFGNDYRDLAQKLDEYLGFGNDIETSKI